MLCYVFARPLYPLTHSRRVDPAIFHDARLVITANVVASRRCLISSRDKIAAAQITNAPADWRRTTFCTGNPSQRHRLHSTPIIRNNLIQLIKWAIRNRNGTLFVCMRVARWLSSTRLRRSLAHIRAAHTAPQQWLQQLDKVIQNKQHPIAGSIDGSRLLRAIFLLYFFFIFYLFSHTSIKSYAIINTFKQCGRRSNDKLRR